MRDRLALDGKKAGGYFNDEQGNLIARAGEHVDVRDRLALDGKKAGGYFNQQIVEPIQGKNGPLGYLRLTLDTHTLPTEAKQVDNTTNILRLMLLLFTRHRRCAGAHPASRQALALAAIPVPADRQQLRPRRRREREERLVIK